MVEALVILGGGDNGGTDPEEGGGTIPTEPSTPSIFDESFSFMGDSWTYNGDGSITDRFGNSFQGTIDGEDMVFTNSSGNTMRINKDGFLTEESKAWGSGGQYDVKQTYSKDSKDGTYSNYGEYSGKIQFNDTTINGVVHAGSYPSYIDTFDFDSIGFQAYQNFYNATDALKQRINATPTGDSFQLDNEALNNYNTAKQNYISFLNQQKANGTQLSSIDELLLSKS